MILAVNLPRPRHAAVTPRGSEATIGERLMEAIGMLGRFELRDGGVGGIGDGLGQLAAVGFGIASIGGPA